MKRTELIALVSIFTLLACSKKEPVALTMPEDPEPQSIQITDIITEASGITDSRKYPGHLWVHEDSGKPAQLYLLSHNGQLAGTLHLPGITNRDWEDIALAGDYLYLADTGDNNQVYSTSTIYRFPEPDITASAVQDVERIQFRYPDGPHDVEAILVDATNEEIYLLTKRDIPARIYKISAAPKNKQLQTAELVGTLPVSGVVSASLSAKGFILKTYTGLYFYARTAHQSVGSTLLQGNYSSLPYLVEPQGEAVTFSVDGNGYFTLSEKLRTAPVNLHYYRLK